MNPGFLPIKALVLKAGIKIEVVADSLMLDKGLLLVALSFKPQGVTTYSKI